MPNQALHRTTIPLRFIAAGELGRLPKTSEAHPRRRAVGDDARLDGAAVLYV